MMDKNISFYFSEENGRYLQMCTLKKVTLQTARAEKTDSLFHNYEVRKCTLGLTATVNSLFCRIIPKTARLKEKVYWA
jgi:hypothetical protein